VIESFPIIISMKIEGLFLRHSRELVRCKIEGSNAGPAFRAVDGMASGSEASHYPPQVLKEWAGIAVVLGSDSELLNLRV
jgi:hypothetical protein